MRIKKKEPLNSRSAIPCVNENKFTVFFDFVQSFIQNLKTIFYLFSFYLKNTYFCIAQVFSADLYIFVSVFSFFLMQI